MGNGSLSDAAVVCYVYEIAVDGLVRYVGKGTGKRASHHRKVASWIINRRAAGQRFWARKFYNRLAKAIRLGQNVTETIIARGLSDEDAFALETVRIASHPPGQPWNDLAGGPGATSEYIKALWATPEFRAKVLAGLASSSSAIRRNLAKARTIRWSDPGQRARQSAIGKTAFRHLALYRLENPGKRTDFMAQAWAEPGFRAKISASRKREWEGEAGALRRSAMVEYMAHVWSDAEVRNKISRTVREHFRAELAAGTGDLFEDKE